MDAGLPVRWQADWVWCGDTGVRIGELEGERDPEVVDRFVMLRRVFAVGDPPAHALFRAVANSRLIAWVNGVEVARGPVRTDPRRVCDEVVDVTPALRPGRNVVAVLARYHDVATSWWLPGPVAAARGVGASLRGRYAALTSPRSEPATQDRAGPFEAPLPHDRPADRLPLRPQIAFVDLDETLTRTRPIFTRPSRTRVHISSYGRICPRGRGRAAPARCTFNALTASARVRSPPCSRPVPTPHGIRKWGCVPPRSVPRERVAPLPAASSKRSGKPTVRLFGTAGLRWIAAR